MLLSVNGINEQLEQYISSNYEFRKNLINKILGKELLEYRRADATQWSPVSNFISRERRSILKAQEKTHEGDQELYPKWLIEKIALNQSAHSQDYIENVNHLKIIDEYPTKVSGVKPVRTSKRTPVHLDEGDKCYISFGRKKGLFGKYSRALPAIVESIRKEGNVEYYNILIVKLNSKSHTVDYFGRHLVMSTEVGKTPKEAAQNIAYSQAIY
ncbi:MAG: hypothetical protein JXQ87_15950 [Bacteroidia bacterium]